MPSCLATTTMWSTWACKDTSHPAHRVAVGVLGVGVGPLHQEQVVEALVAEAGGPGEGVLPHVGQALGGLVGSPHLIGRLHHRPVRLLVLGHEEDSPGPLRAVGTTGNQHLGHLVVAIGNSQVEARGTW